MNAVADAVKKATRERQFGRVYDHEKGTVTITCAFDPTFSHTVELDKIPAETLRGFALQNIADYIVQEANETLKDESITDETERQAASLLALKEATQEAVEGDIDFRSGAGLGGMRSAIGALGTVLFELGKKFVVDQFGKQYEITDLHSARAAVKTLYKSTEPKGPFTPKVDDKGQPVLHTGGPNKGKQMQTPVNKDSNLTGRMIFNAIMDVPEIKAAMEAKRTPPKPKAKVDAGSLMG